MNQENYEKQTTRLILATEVYFHQLHISKVVQKTYYTESEEQEMEYFERFGIDMHYMYNSLLGYSIKGNYYYRQALEDYINTHQNMNQHKYFQSMDWIRLAERKFKSLTDTPPKKFSNSYRDRIQLQYAIRFGKGSRKQFARIKPQEQDLSRVIKEHILHCQGYWNIERHLPFRYCLKPSVVGKFKIDYILKVIIGLDDVDVDVRIVVILLVEVVYNNKELHEYLVEKILDQAITKLSYYVELIILLIKQETSWGGQPLFKVILLEQLQQIMEALSIPYLESIFSHSEKKELRRTKVYQTLPLICQLFLRQILSNSIFGHVIQILIMEYVHRCESDDNYRIIEGLVDMLDSSGGAYTQKGGYDKIALWSIFDGKCKKYSELKLYFQSPGICNMPEPAIFEILDILKTYDKLSYIVIIQIENLQERRRNGWKVNEPCPAQFYKACYASSLAKVMFGHFDQCLYYDRICNEEEEKFEYDIYKMGDTIEQTFTMEPNAQCEVLQAEFKKIQWYDDERLVKYFEVFFRQILKPKISNFDRLFIVAELIENAKKCQVELNEGLQKAFHTHDFIHNICESPVGMKVFVKILSYFIAIENYLQLQRMYLRPIEDNEEYEMFFKQVIEQLIILYPFSKRPLAEYTILLKFNFEIE